MLDRRISHFPREMRKSGRFGQRLCLWRCSLTILASGRRFELGRILVSIGGWRKPRGSAPRANGGMVAALGVSQG